MRGQESFSLENYNSKQSLEVSRLQREKEKRLKHVNSGEHSKCVFVDNQRNIAVSGGIVDLKKDPRIFNTNSSLPNYQKITLVTNILHQEAIYFKNSGNFSQAKRCFDKIFYELEDDENILVLTTKAQTEVESGRYEEALLTMETISKISPIHCQKSLPLIRLQARALFCVGEFEKSLILFHRKGIFF